MTSTPRATRRTVVGTALGVSALISPLLAGSASAAPLAPHAPAARSVAAVVAPCTLFPSNDIWHRDISRLPVNRYSAVWMSHMSPTRRLHPDFGPSGNPRAPYGIPVTTVSPTTRRVAVRFTYASESDRIGYPLSASTKIEGGSDRHAVMVDPTLCRLYETFATVHTSTGWTAGSGASWNLRSNALRPAGWTSADAAGLPILPGLLTLAEVKRGRVNHAIRFTTTITSRAYLWPARHQAGSVSSPAYPPMGARFRLKASFTISRYSASTRVVLQAMKTYGLILADNGSPWFFQGTADNAWPSLLLDQLKSVPASAFEAVDESSLRISANSGQSR